MNIKDLTTNQLKKELVERGFIDVFWHIDDIKYVIDIISDDAYPTDKKALKDIACDLAKNHDANIGINWNVIEDTIIYK